MLAWTRLPTPVPHGRFSTASNSVSPDLSPKSLSICSPSSAGTSYSADDGLLLSPSHSPNGSSSSKTAAFFSSPFAAAGPPTPAPPAAPLRSATLAADVTYQRKPTVPSRSATADFFAMGALGQRPTPPPSMKSSASSREPSPPRLPPLSRFFPSRYATDPTLEEGEEELSKHRKAGSDWETSFKREFLQLTEDAENSRSPSPPLSSSPTDTKRNVSSFMTSPPPMEYLRLPNPHHDNAIKREGNIISATRGSSDSGFEETISSPPALSAGTRLTSGHAAVTLVRVLGEGAFSSVWLAADDGGTLASPTFPASGDAKSSRPGLRRKSSSWAKKGRDARLHGLRPTPPVTAGSGFSRKLLDEQDGEGASAAADASFLVNDSKGRLVAVKMMNRALCDANDRTRISFVREVEVLRHIAHPSIVSYLHSFTTHMHHCLMLEYVGGGELFDLVNCDVQYIRASEASVRRIWGELCRAVGWMHGVALVHRDIKLENIILTRNIFATDEPLPPLHTPLIKLTDFGLSRFIDPSSPLLSTRCGSESYAAPELVLGASATSSESDTPANGEPRGHYDGRQTDAWACGVVLYALATRQLPFDVPPPLPLSTAPSRTGSVKSDRSAGSVHRRVGNRRRDMLMRIAQCEYYWPDEFVDDDEDDAADEVEEKGSPAATARRLASPGLKRVVRRLLERNPVRRARMVELWDELWLREEGAPAPPLCAARRGAENEEDAGRDGMLLDEEHIDSVASQELEPL
ncbi:kinase-like protein [Phellopilus nigrolimitatus]|nr:kinase-like protein [Phellopilus nigrolimitatus]